MDIIVRVHSADPFLTGLHPSHALHGACLLSGEVCAMAAARGGSYFKMQECIHLKHLMPYLAAFQKHFLFIVPTFISF